MPNTETSLQDALNAPAPASLSTDPIVDATETPEATPGKRTYKKRAKSGETNTPAADALDVLLNETETPAATPAAKPTRNKKKSGTDATALGKQLVGIHQLAALVTGIPELQLADEEGVLLGNAVAAICEEYNLSIDGKTGAGLQLFGAAAMIYLPRFIGFKRRIAHEQAANANATEG